MTYYIEEEASGATVGIYTDDLQGAIAEAKQLGGKHLVKDYDDNVLFDTMPNVTYKI